MCDAKIRTIAKIKPPLYNGSAKEVFSMKTLYEKLGGTYTRQGDYLLPDIKLPEQPEYEIGVWGQRRRRFLKEHHRVLYYNMMTKCTLYPYLAEVDQQAQDMFFRLVDEMAKHEGITEQLKAADQMEWVRRMNNIQNRATEIVDAELIYQGTKQ